MQEISPNIYIENQYPGVTLAAIRCQRGLILIDAPLRIDDARQWRSLLAGMSGGFERLLITLDEHYDRTLGTRQMECRTTGHEALNHILHDRPLSFKNQGQETGSEWELVNSLGVIRWAVPDFAFTHALDLYWDSYPVLLRTVAGPSRASIWVELPQQHIVFVGDTVVSQAPPFLAAADLPDWLHALEYLLSPVFKDYAIVSGRGGIITANDVKEQKKFLARVNQVVERLSGKENDPREIERSCLQLLKNFDSGSYRYTQYLPRLVFGLTQYLKHHLPAGASRNER